MHIRFAHHLFDDYIFRRGVDYMEWGLVRRRPLNDPHVFDMVVDGTRPYNIQIAVDDVGHVLSHTCDCGVHHCKHLAASFIVLSQRQSKDYEVGMNLKLDSNINANVQDPALLHTVVIEQLAKALEVASKNENIDLLFEAYEYYTEQMHWLIDHYCYQSALVVLEYMMDEIVSYWTASNNDLEQMNFFKKQTLWIKSIASSYQIDPRRLISDVLLWTQLYPEIKDEVKGMWLVALCVFASDDLIRDDILHVIASVSEGIDHPKLLAEIEFSYKLHADEEGIETYALAHLDSDLIRNYLIDIYLKKHESQKVIQLCREKIRKSPKHEDVVWVGPMLEAYRQLDDDMGFRATLKWMYYCGEHYALEHLRSITDRRIWREVVDDMIREFHQGAYSDWVYRHLLTEEKRWEQMAVYVSKNPYFIAQLYPYLMDPYPHMVYDLLIEHIDRLYRREKRIEIIMPWISVISEYFSEAEGWQLIEKYKS
jgi:hypothetical protein